MFEQLLLTDDELGSAADQVLFVWSDESEFLENQSWIDDFGWFAAMHYCQSYP